MPFGLSNHLVARSHSAAREIVSTEVLLGKQLFNKFDRSVIDKLALDRQRMPCKAQAASINFTNPPHW